MRPLASVIAAILALSLASEAKAEITYTYMATLRDPNVKPQPDDRGPLASWRFDEPITSAFRPGAGVEMDVYLVEAKDPENGRRAPSNGTASGDCPPALQQICPRPRPACRPVRMRCWR